MVPIVNILKRLKPKKTFDIDYQDHTQRRALTLV